MAKIKFPCGHKGKGKFCHRCEQKKKPITTGHILSNTPDEDLFEDSGVETFQEELDRVRSERFYRSGAEELERKKNQ